MVITEGVLYLFIWACALNVLALCYVAWKLFSVYQYLAYINLKRAKDREDQVRVCEEMQNLLKMIKQTHMALLNNHGVDSEEVLERYQKTLN